MPNNILITPGSASIQFSGSVGNTIRLQVEPSGSVAFYGNSGSLFGISDSLSGSLMSVNDISGLPILEVFSDDRVMMGTFNRNTLVVTGSRVGMGTATPSTNLHLYTTSTGVEILAEKSSTYANRFGVNSSNVAYVGSNNATALQLQTNASARLYIDTSGNVGIGTTSPGSLLHIQGAISASSYNLDSTAGIYKSGNRLTVRSESTDDVANFASYGLYLPKNGQTAGLYAESPIEARSGIRLGSGAINGTIEYGATTTNTANRMVLRDGSGNFSAGTITATLSGQASSVANTVTFNNGGSGDASGTTYNGSAARTISYNTIGAPKTDGTNASGTWGINITGNAATVSDITAVQFFNNMGQIHGARTSFDASTPSYGFGFRYVQGSTNGPGTSGTQFYSWYIGLGNDYPSTGAGSYGAMFAVDRNVSNPYLSVRYNENNSFGVWRKIYAGYADTAGTAGNITAYTINQSVGTSNTVQFSGVGAGTAGAANEVRATGEITAYYSSDKRLKENIQPLNNALNKLLRVNGVEFDWTEEYINKRGGEDGYFVRKHDVGIIAQEIQEVLPEVVAERTDGYLAVRYEKIVPLLIEAIKELQAEVDALKKQR